MSSEPSKIKTTSNTPANSSTNNNADDIFPLKYLFYSILFVVIFLLIMFLAVKFDA